MPRPHRPATEKATPPAAASTAAAAGATGSVPLARYVPREKLILYVEFAGLRRPRRGVEEHGGVKMLERDVPRA